MRKGFLIFLLIFLLMSAGTETSEAFFGFGKPFGGRIVFTKAKEIAILEAMGYECPVFGTSISILPIGSPAGTPADYFIPAHVNSITRNTPNIRSLIKGKYSGKVNITCVLPEPPDMKTVSLDVITMFGVSGSTFRGFPIGASWVVK